MIKSLRSTVEDYLHAPIASAGITTMHLAALYPEDLRDACEYLGLQYLPVPLRYQLLYETAAAYAGYGYELCHDFRDRDARKEYQDHLDQEVVMAVLLTPAVLTVTLSLIKSAYYLWEPDNRHISNFSLGFASVLRQRDENDYWLAVKSQLEAIMAEYPYYPRPTRVMLMGNCVDNPRFSQTLKEALSDQMTSLPIILGRESEFVAAKGAAELTKRLPWDPYAPNPSRLSDHM
ncbi:MAG: hypothetical protein Q9213_007932 [Squamulea squamosa]